VSDQSFGCGGRTSNYGNYQRSVYRYDLSENSWLARTSMTYYRSQGTGASASLDGYVYGGHASVASPDYLANASFKVEKYNIAGNSWSILDDQPVNSGGGPGGPYPLGGYIYSTTIKFDYANATWRSYLTSGIGGGWFKVGSHLYQSESISQPCIGKKYSPDSDSWSVTTGCSQWQQQPGNFADETYGYFHCGYGTSGQPVGTTTRYDPSGDVWAARSAQSTYCRGGSMFNDGSGHTIGGSSGHENGVPCNNHQRYDNAGNSWAGKAAYPTSLFYLRGFSTPGNTPPSAPTGVISE